MLTEKNMTLLLRRTHKVISAAAVIVLWLQCETKIRNCVCVWGRRWVTHPPTLTAGVFSLSKVLVVRKRDSVFDHDDDCYWNSFLKPHETAFVIWATLLSVGSLVLIEMFSLGCLKCVRQVVKDGVFKIKRDSAEMFESPLAPRRAVL